MEFDQYKPLFTCEHGGNNIPKKYQHLFKKESKLLRSHRAYDIGALKLARNLHSKIPSHLTFTQVSRLIVDTNRSPWNSSLFSKFTKNLLKPEKQSILNNYYFPFRNQTEILIEKSINKKQAILNLSLHSFTPILNGQIRNSDIGLLYNPQCLVEKQFCHQLKIELSKIAPEFKVRFNYPYLGITDGFSVYLSKKFPNRKRFFGVCLEFNQAIFKNFDRFKRLKFGLNLALKSLLQV